MNFNKKRKGRRSREEARQEILDMAVKFLWAHPFRDLTVPRLMEHTSIGRSAFYVYFQDRYQLVEALLQIPKDLTTQAIFPWMRESDDPIKGLYTALKAVVDVFVIHGPVIRAVAEAAPLDHKLDILWNSYLETFDNAVESAIVRDQKAGLIDSFNAAEVAYAINRMDIAYLNGRLGQRPQADPEGVLETLFVILSKTLYGKVK